MASFDISNLYTNVPLNETAKFLNSNLVSNSKLSKRSNNEINIPTTTMPPTKLPFF